MYMAVFGLLEEATHWWHFLMACLGHLNRSRGSLYEPGFDNFSYGRDLKVGVDGVVWNKPGRVKNVAEDFRLESLDAS